MLVLGYRQRDERVCVEQERAHSSASADATSSEVMVRPMERTGSPERPVHRERYWSVELSESAYRQIGNDGGQ